MHGTQSTFASELVGSLEEWIASGNPISIQAQLLTPDTMCVVVISSTGVEECGSRPAAATVMEEPSAIPIIISTSVGFVFLILLTLLGGLIVIFLFKRKRQRAKVVNLQEDIGLR